MLKVVSNAKTKVNLKQQQLWVLAWDCNAGHYFEFLIPRCLVLNIFPFLVRTAKLLGNFYNKQAKRCKQFSLLCLFFRFSYAAPILQVPRFVICQQAKHSKENKICENFLLALQIRLLRLQEPLIFSTSLISIG